MTLPIQTPTFFYLFPKREDIDILKLRTDEALKLWERGKHWIDMPQKTLLEATELKLKILEGRSKQK